MSSASANSVTRVGDKKLENGRKQLFGWYMILLRRRKEFRAVGITAQNISINQIQKMFAYINEEIIPRQLQQFAIETLTGHMALQTLDMTQVLEHFQIATALMGFDLSKCACNNIANMTLQCFSAFDDGTKNPSILGLIYKWSLRARHEQDQHKTGTAVRLLTALFPSQMFSNSLVYVIPSESLTGWKFVLQGILQSMTSTNMLRKSQAVMAFATAIRCAPVSDARNFLNALEDELHHSPEGTTNEVLLLLLLWDCYMKMPWMCPADKIFLLIKNQHLATYGSFVCSYINIVGICKLLGTVIFDNSAHVVQLLNSIVDHVILMQNTATLVKTNVAKYVGRTFPASLTMKCLADQSLLAVSKCLQNLGGNVNKEALLQEAVIQCCVSIRYSFQSQDKLFLKWNVFYDCMFGKGSISSSNLACKLQLLLHGISLEHMIQLSHSIIHAINAVTFQGQDTYQLDPERDVESVMEVLRSLSTSFDST